jgi:hypothetical protein
MVSITELTRLELQAMKVTGTEFGNLLEEPTVYGEHRVSTAVWTFSWMDEVGISPNILRGVMSSLVKKGLIGVEGKGNDETLSYTDEGRKICKILNGLDG